jgi:hypothetical protein
MNHFLAFAAAVLLGCSNKSESTLARLPSAAEVQRVDVILVGEQFGSGSPQTFVLPTEYIADVLRFLEPATFLEHPVKGEEIAALHFKCADHRVVDIHLLFFGKNTAVFTVDGLEYARSGRYEPVKVGADGYEGYLAESAAIGEVLYLVHQGKSAEAQERIYDLDVSAGRKPRRPQAQ